MAIQVGVRVQGANGQTGLVVLLVLGNATVLWDLLSLGQTIVPVSELKEYEPNYSFRQRGYHRR